MTMLVCALLGAVWIFYTTLLLHISLLRTYSPRIYVGLTYCALRDIRVLGEYLQRAYEGAKNAPLAVMMLRRRSGPAPSRGRNHPPRRRRGPPLQG